MEGRDPASFRDPSGWVLHRQGRIFRKLSASSAAIERTQRAKGLYAALERDGLLLPSWYAAPDDAGPDDGGAWLEHPVLPLISYPYEWSFGALKAAALHHLAVQLRALEFDVGLTDATAYNIQFLNGRPVFIDLTSLVPYRDGEYWRGYKQFCEQFLYPLLMTSIAGIPFNALYAGSMHGIPAGIVRRMIPWHAKLKPFMLMHVVAADSLSHRADNASSAAKRRPFSRDAYRALLIHFRGAIERLVPTWRRNAGWRDYAGHSPYDGAAHNAKIAFVRETMAAWRPARLLDLGCNTGEFSQLALEAGAGLAIGAESDPATADAAFTSVSGTDTAFHPLVIDLTDPPGGRGWANEERRPLIERARPDTVLALAVVHHLAVAGVPLSRVIDWITAIAPRGIVEFIPRSDPMLDSMAKSREAPLLDYAESVFFERLGASNRIVRRELLPNGRILVSYERA